MPRKRRFFVQGFPVHIVQRGNNRQAIFFEDADYELYLSLLSAARDRFGCDIHAYVLMTNHTHILATPWDDISIGKMMQYVGRHYVPYVNQKYCRTGTLWEGRYKATTVETSSYLLACYRYIELNPVRAGMVQHSGEYRWSSYRRNGLQLENGLITPHPEYDGLGGDAEERSSSYRRLFEEVISERELDLLRTYTQSGTPLGHSKFKDQIEAALSVKTGQPRRGRPKSSGSE